MQSNIASDEIDLKQYYKILKRYKWAILLITVLSLIVGFVYINKTIPIYQAPAKIQADPVQPNASLQDQYVANSTVFLFYETQYEIILSRKVAETVVDKLDLVERNSSEKDNEDSTQTKAVVLDWIIKIKSFFDDEEENIPVSDEDIRIQLAQSIQGNLNVEGGTQSQIINISYQSEDPQLAADVVNAVSDAYIEFGLNARLSQIKDTSQWLGEQLEDLRGTLQLSEDRLRDFRVSQNMMDTEQQQRIVNTQLQTLNTELVRAQTMLSEAKELYDQVIQVENSGGNYRSLGPVLQSNTIRDLVREETTLVRKVQELSERYGEKHPKMIAARSDLASAQENLNAEAQKISANIKSQYRSAKAQADNVKQLIAETRNNLQSYQGESFELTRLEREVENNRRIYENFLAKLMETDVSVDYDASNIRIIDRAIAPNYPIKPRKSIIVVASIVMGLMIGILYALGKETLGQVFRTPDELESVLQISSLGVTPLVRKSKIAPEKQYLADQRSTFAEAINTIRTGVLFSNIDNPPQSILITSTYGSEGKTTLSINLAISMAQLGKTALIELDLRKPMIAKDLGLAQKPGISEFLTGAEEQISLRRVEDNPNLDIIVSGSIPTNPIELLASNKFKEMLDTLKSKYDYIVIDSPPTLPVSDSCVLAKMCDFTIIAVKAEDTKLSSAKETISRLQKVNAKIGGCVLTQASPKKMSYYGEHYYQDKYYGTKEMT